MRKWTYLVAALLMSGTAATFTSCIDTTEPAGIETLRGAKAELLQAKAKVELAEAEKRLADARWTNALAAAAEEDAKQAAFDTALKEAQTEQQKQEIEQQKQLSAEKFKTTLAVAQQEAAEADYTYKQALLKLQIVLATMQEDVYAQELNDFLTSDVYKYEVPKYKLVDKEITIGEGDDAFEITIPELERDGDQAFELKGYSALITELSDAKYELAGLLNQKATIEFGQTDDKEALKAKNSALKAYYEGEKAAWEESRDELKQLQGTPVEDWKTKYEQYAKDKDDLEEQKTVLQTKLKEDKLPFEEKIEDLNEQKNIKSPVKFEADAAIQKYFYEILNINVQIDDVMKYELESQIIKNEKGEVSFPNGITLSTSPSDLKTLLEKIIGPSTTSQKAVMDYVKAGNDQAIWQQNLLKAKTNMDDAQNAYNAELEIWSGLLEDFKAKADAYRYNYKSNQAKNRYDGRTNVIKDIDAFLEKRHQERTAQDTINVIDSISNYLDGRYELDAFEVKYTYTPQGTTEQKIITYQEALNDEDLVEDALPKFITLYNKAPSYPYEAEHTAALGSELLLISPNGLYGKLQASAEKLWGNPLYYDPNPTNNPNHEWKEASLDALSVLVPYTQEDWENIEYKSILTGLYQNGFEMVKVWYPKPNDYTWLILGDGLANDLFASTYVYEEINSESNPAWNTLLTALEEMQKENNDALKAIDDQITLNKLEIAKLTETEEREKAKIDVQLTTIKGMLDIIGEVVDVTGSTGNTTSKDDWKEAFEELEDEIIEIDGGVKSDGTYTEGEIAKTEKWIKYYTDFNTAIDAGDYTPLKDAEIYNIDKEIEAKNIAIEALEALKTAADKKKEILLAGINGTATE
ncbi:hypothetical protein [uncultured Bacteroides sp.]|uniref:hypothetical protein n=1 Tax=uncultured Bacteroides sp. TaxID=162156 RepID=UPI002594BA70|nr:hypothetical protein [uncultured Bacteroides sp.]